LLAGSNAPGLSSFTIKLPRGLSFAAVRRHGRLRVSGVSVTGARVRSVVFSHAHLIVTLRRAVRRLSVKLGPRALKETRALKRAAKSGRIRQLTVTIVIKDAAGHATTVPLRISYSH
jgi:hypothetical protein